MKHLPKRRLTLRQRTTPDRTCIGCRRKASTDELIRLVIGPRTSNVVVGGSGGRGAWLCRVTLEACFDRAVTTRALGRAFRQRVDEQSLVGVREQLAVVHSGEDARLPGGPFPS